MILPRPVLVFDGDCGMCTTSAGLLERRFRRSADDYDIEPSQRLDLAALNLTPEQCEEALQFVDVDGTTSSGHAAVAAVLRASAWWARPAGHLIDAPGARKVAAVAYRWVAQHRQIFPGGTPACALPADHQQGES